MKNEKLVSAFLSEKGFLLNFNCVVAEKSVYCS